MSELNEDRLSKQLTILEQMSAYLDKHGIVNTISSVLMIVFVSFCFYIIFNIDSIFGKYEEYVEKTHMESTEFRLKSAPLVRSLLNQMAMEIGADRAYVFEFHNGKKNPSGQQWQFADMTFISDKCLDISDEYQNMPLVKYNIANELYLYGQYFGTIEEVENVDPRIAMRLKLNDVKKIYTVTLYSENMIEIGFIGVSFLTDEIEISDAEVMKILHKYSTKISPCLDWDTEKKHRRK